MKLLPSSPDLSHLKRQAKRLLRAALAGEDSALRRLGEARVVTPPRLHDAQLVVAREYGFRSWAELKRYVEWKHGPGAERLERLTAWMLDGGPAERRLALRLLGEEPELLADDPWLACMAGDEARLYTALATIPDFANRNGGPRAMPPLVAITHSRLVLETDKEQALLACARLLLRHGADVNSSWTDPRWPDSRLSALYGAAGRNRHPGMTKLLLEAGADPNDNESLYHSVESSDDTCTRLLLDAGARVIGTNAIGRVLDFDRLDRLRLLLRHGGGAAAEHPWIHHAIRRGRSLEHVQALIDAGADLHATGHGGQGLYRWALLHGRTDVAALLRKHGLEEELEDGDAFVAACACGDEPAARAIAARTADIFAELTDWQLRTLPRLAAIGDLRAVRTMLALGWPREVRAEWDATALNLAVFQGDAEMARLLLAQDADWRTPHGFGDNVLGTLSFASRAEDIGDPAPRDYAGCARALLDYGVPPSAFQGYTFSTTVSTHLEARNDSHA
ncbi:MAG TPA: hypothetical protein PKA13_05840 [Geminicoccaceae bacterium]|nr:hypothetical protein [Geminicoccus sp.]HMU49276.1 hypothetical protein [Geminicoccaceae bacterium]